MCHILFFQIKENAERHSDWCMYICVRMQLSALRLSILSCSIASFCCMSPRCRLCGGTGTELYRGLNSLFRYVIDISTYYLHVTDHDAGRGWWVLHGELRLFEVLIDRFVSHLMLCSFVLLVESSEWQSSLHF